jgi:hypothetical protein
MAEQTSPRAWAGPGARDDPLWNNDVGDRHKPETLATQSERSALALPIPDAAPNPPFVRPVGERPEQVRIRAGWTTIGPTDITPAVIAEP